MTKGEQARLMAWRLRVLQQAADEENVARVCRRFGLSRNGVMFLPRRSWNGPRKFSAVVVGSPIQRSRQPFRIVARLRGRHR